MEPTTGGKPVNAGSDGKRTIKLLPSSPTLIEKSVPLTDTTAVGVLIFTFSLLFLEINPEVYLMVPDAALIDKEPLPLDGS